MTYRVSATDLRPLKPARHVKRTGKERCPDCDHEMRDHRKVAGDNSDYCYGCMESPCGDPARATANRKAAQQAKRGKPNGKPAPPLNSSGRKPNFKSRNWSTPTKKGTR